MKLHVLVIASFLSTIACYNCAAGQTNFASTTTNSSLTRQDSLEIVSKIKKESKALDLAIKNKSPRGRYDSYQRLAGLEFKRGNNYDAIKNAFRALQLYNLHHWKDVEIRGVHNVLSRSMENMGAYSDAIRHQKITIDLYDPSSKKIKGQFFNIIRVGALYMQLRQYDSSLYYFQKGEQFATLSKHIELQAHSYNNIGLAYFKMDKLKLASKYYQKSIDKFTALNDTSASTRFMLTLIKGNLAECLPHNDPRKAQYFEEDIEGSLLFKNYSNAVQSASHYAEMLLELGKANEALRILIDAERITENYPVQVEAKISMYHQFVKVYAKLGRSQRSIAYHEKQIQLLDQIGGKKIIDSHLRLHSNYQLNKIENELELEILQGKKKAIQIQALNYKSNLSRFRLRASILVSILIVALLAFIIFKLRSDVKKKAKEKMLQEKLHRIESEYHTERLQRSALTIERKKDLSERIMKQISTFDNLSSQQQNSIKFTLLNEVEIDNSIIELEKEIHSIGEEFIAQLKIKFPKLSESDLKLISLIKMKLSNKQIAEIKNIDPNSVKTAKNRLRKKLNIPKGSDFGEVLSI